MAWTKEDYPGSMKNLADEVRFKAIDIANFLQDHGLKEESAIPIAIDKAQAWDRLRKRERKWTD